MIKKIPFIFLVLSYLVITFLVVKDLRRNKSIASGAPPYGLAFDDFPRSNMFSWLADWERPDEPVRVGLQVGHLKNSKLPEELRKHIGNTGSRGGGYTEAEVNLMIAKKVAQILQNKGVKVDILPATVPKSYWADAFVAIHADGSLDGSTRGFKIASPWQDYSGGADDLVDQIVDSYQRETKLPIDDNVTQNMRGYYAFAWWKYEHAVHPMTPAVIVETGFLTNPSDRRLLVNSTKIPARGIAEGIIGYLKSKNLLT